jgi:hypothetical protein
MKLKSSITLLIALTMQLSFSQETKVSGIVSDNTGPIPGVNVIVKSTNQSAQTDFDGKYAVTAKKGDVLLFSFIGMQNKSVTVGVSNSINVILESEA